MASRFQESRPASGALPVLLFDGDCGLCHRLVRLLLRLDRAGRLHFSPLQSGSAQDYLRSHGLPTRNFESLVFVPDWSRRDQPDFRQRTDGAIAALRTCGGLGRALAALIAVWPRAWRDVGYRAVGHWRYRLFGPWRPRPPARAEWAGRFLP